MPSTLLLDRASWDLVLDANGNIALASEPYSLSQDAASAIRTFLGECYWDTTVGVPWLTQIFGVPNISIKIVKQLLVNAALTVPDVVAAQVFITGLTQRTLTGQVQVTQGSTGATSVAPFTITNIAGE